MFVHSRKQTILDEDLQEMRDALDMDVRYFSLSLSLSHTHTHKSNINMKLEIRRAYGENYDMSECLSLSG